MGAETTPSAKFILFNAGSILIHFKKLRFRPHE